MFSAYIGRILATNNHGGFAKDRRAPPDGLISVYLVARRGRFVRRHTGNGN